MSDAIRACPLCKWCDWVQSGGRPWFSCRFNSPIPSTDNSAAYFPIVCEGDWCREFKTAAIFEHPKGKCIVYLPEIVYGDGPFANTVAMSGNHIAHVNKHGAVSVVAKDGTLLGVKPDEFEWVQGKVTR